MNTPESITTRRLKRCFRDVFADALPEDVTTAEMGNVATWDSMMTWNLVLLLQEQFGITIGLDQIPNLTSFAAVAAYIGRKMPSAT
jgi:acyl carrier protein